MAEETYTVVIDEDIRLKVMDIANYLMENVSHHIAEKVQNELFEAMDNLNKMPTRHGLVRNMPPTIMTYRRVIKWSYLIIFCIDDIDKQLIVVDIVHEKQNPQSLLDRLSD